MFSTDRTISTRRTKTRTTRKRTTSRTPRTTRSSPRRRRTTKTSPTLRGSTTTMTPTTVRVRQPGEEARSAMPAWAPQRCSPLSRSRTTRRAGSTPSPRSPRVVRRWRREERSFFPSYFRPRKHVFFPSLTALFSESKQNQIENQNKKQRTSPTTTRRGALPRLRSARSEGPRPRRRRRKRR